jgi:hypothetical protein
MKSIRIEVDERGTGTKVFVDGREVPDVFKLILDVEPRRPPRLTLGILARAVVVEGSAEVVEVEGEARRSADYEAEVVEVER